jgi:hypothetical protein
MSGARGVFPESFKREAVDRGAGGGPARQRPSWAGTRRRRDEG